MRTVIACLAFLSLAQPSFAETPLGPPKLSEELPPTFAWATRSPTAGQIQLGARAIPFEKIKLTDVANSLKQTVGERQDQNSAMHWICLNIGTQRYWLTSDENGGGRINGVAAAEVAAGDKSDKTCRASAAKVGVPQGLAIGMAESDLRAKLGKATYDRAGVIGWLFSGKTGEGEVNSHLWVKVAGGRVTGFEMAQATSL
jgi:hypothetical protein